jgi:hypothetical protein
MTVREIVAEYIKEHGFDGLYCADECACGLDNLIPCDGGGLSSCCTGYRVRCDCGEGCDCHIVAERPEEYSVRITNQDPAPQPAEVFPP